MKVRRIKVEPTELFYQRLSINTELRFGAIHKIEVNPEDFKKHGQVEFLEIIPMPGVLPNEAWVYYRLTPWEEAEIQDSCSLSFIQYKEEDWVVDKEWKDPHLPTLMPLP